MNREVTLRTLDTDILPFGAISLIDPVKLTSRAMVYPEGCCLAQARRLGEKKKPISPSPSWSHFLCVLSHPLLSISPWCQRGGYLTPSAFISGSQLWFPEAVATRQDINYISPEPRLAPILFLILYCCAIRPSRVNNEHQVKIRPR